MRRVLVVDDDVMQRTLIVQHLAVLPNLLVNTAESAATALVLLGRRTYHVAIIDVVMAQLSGDTLVWTVRALHGPRPFVLLISAMAENKLADLAAACGANATLVKPFSGAALLSIVRPWLDR